MRHTIAFHEGMTHSFTTSRGGYVEVFQNPTRREYAECAKNHAPVGVLLYHTDWYCWSRDTAFHTTVMQELQTTKGLAQREMIPLLMMRDGAEVDLMVTDASRHTRWFQNPDLPDVIHAHPAFRNTRITLGYYNEAIVGDWAELDDQ